MDLTYEEYVKTKIRLAERCGLTDVSMDDLPDGLLPHAQDVALWALRQGRALIAASFGLTKTRIQCAIAQVLHERTGQPFLVVAPLGVRHQFTHEDGPAMGQAWQYVRTDDEARAATTPYLITNYERVRDGGIDPRQHDFCGASLDEGAVLRNMDTKTSDVFCEVFAEVPMLFVATATPAPNRYREIIYYARFLRVVPDLSSVLNEYFGRNPEKAGDLQIYPHREEEFWLWVSSWALFLSRPSDLGHPDDGYVLPELRVEYHRVTVDQTRAWDQTDNRGQHRLLIDTSGSIVDATREARDTVAARVAEARRLMQTKPEAHWLLWHYREDERREIERTIPEAVTAYGSQGLEAREQAILDFTHGRIRVLASKPELSGSGCNFQRHCADAIFLGPDYRFADFIQAVHRIYRFLQTRVVTVHIIHTDTQEPVVNVLKAKWQRHDELVERMRTLIKQYGLSHAAIRGELTRNLGVTRQAVRGERFTAVNNDCVLEMERLDDDSVDLIATSIPFGNHYGYVNQYEDFGHNQTDADFWQQMDYLIPHLRRVLKPGRLAAIHVKDRILYGHQTESRIMEVSPFSDETVMAFRKHGFTYQGRRTIVTDVVRENNSSYRLGWTEMTKDASKMGSGLPEYLLLFRKAPTDTSNAYADEPVTKDKRDYSRGRWQIDAHAFWRSTGNVLVASEPYDYEAHVARLEALDAKGNLPAAFFCEPPASHSEWVWDDVQYLHTLNSEQSRRQVEQHVCPLPLDIVERTIRLYSNEEELVLDPFGGLMTVGYVAIRMQRRAYLVELSPQYFADGCRYCQNAEREVLAPTLFDWLAQQQGAA